MRIPPMLWDCSSHGVGPGRTAGLSTPGTCGSSDGQSAPRGVDRSGFGAEGPSHGAEHRFRVCIVFVAGGATHTAPLCDKLSRNDHGSTGNLRAAARGTWIELINDTGLDFPGPPPSLRLGLQKAGGK